MTAAIAMADYTGPEADNLCYAIRKKKEDGPPPARGEVQGRGEEEGHPAAHRRPGLRRLRAVRPLRLQQGPRHLLRADRLPDGLPQGELPDRVHDRGPQRLPRACREGRRGHRRVPPAGDRGPPPDVQKSHALFTVETDASGAPEAIRFGLAAIKNVGEGAIEAIVAVRDGGEEPGRSSRSTTSAGASTSTSVNRRVVGVADQGQRDGLAGTMGALLDALDAALENGARHQRDVAAGQSTLFDLFAPCRRTRARPSSTAARRSRAASGCAGRRSSSACTCPSIRWATSRTSCPST